MTDREELQSELMEQCRLLGMSAERELKLLAEIQQARRTAEYWKSEHIAANVEIERLRAEIDEIKQVEFPRRVQKVADVWRGKVDALRAEIERQKARYALLEESYSLLRTDIEAMKRQAPVAWMCPDDPDSATAFSWKPVACELASCLKRRVPLYLAPGAQTAQTAPSVPKWVLTKDKPHPDKPGLESYEHVPCLIVKSGEIMLRQWNCEHLVWDTEDGDDFYCSARDVTHWMPIQTPPSAQENNDGRT